MRALTILIVAAAPAWFLLAGCGKAETAPKQIPGVSATEVVIGSSSALSGHASFLGTEYTHGSLAYLNTINEQGGVHGRKINFLREDDQYDPPKTVANTQKFITDGAFALFDYVGTPTSVKIIDIVHNARIPVLGFFTGAEPLRTPFRPYMFHVRDSYYAEAEAAVAYLVGTLGNRKPAVLYQDDAFGLAVLSGVQLALQRRSMETVATATYVRGTTDVEAALQTLKASGADAVFMVGTYDPLAKFIALSHQAGWKPHFHTVSFVGSEAFGKALVETHKIAPAEYERIIVTQVVPSPFSENLPTVKEYREQLKKYFPNDVPNYVALEGFVNAKVLVEALRRAGSDLTREKFIEALESMQQVDVGIGMPVTYGALDRRGLEGVYYSRLAEDGTFRTFQPSKAGDGK